jgi:hypothetical protein
MIKVFFIGCLILVVSHAFTYCFEKCNCIRSSGLSYILIGFSDTDSDTIIVRKFRKKGDFTEKLDSILLTAARISFQRKNDTLAAVAQTGNNNLLSLFDYELYFPASGSLFRISDINEQQIRTTCGGPFNRNKDLCINPIRSYSENGQLISDGGNYQFVVLKK